MNTKNTSIASFVISLVLLPLALLFAAGAIASGFAGLNANFQNRVIEYPISESVIYPIKLATIFIFVPISLGVCILSAVNIRRNDKKLIKISLIVCALMVVWMIFINWALTPKPGEYIREEGSSAQPSDGSLQIRSLDF